MKLTAEQIQYNWIDLEETINNYISEPRKSALLDFYQKFQERIMLMPAAHKKEYHNAFPGGYVDHVLRVVDCALKLNDIWIEMGVDDNFLSTITKLQTYYEKFKSKWAKVMASRKKTSVKK